MGHVDTFVTGYFYLYLFTCVNICVYLYTFSCRLGGKQLVDDGYGIIQRKYSAEVLVREVFLALSYTKFGFTESYTTLNYIRSLRFGRSA